MANETKLKILKDETQGKNAYSFEALVAKSDMIITNLTIDVQPNEKGTISSSELANIAKIAALSVGAIMFGKGIKIAVPDIDCDVVLGRNGITHFFESGQSGESFKNTVTVAPHIGEIIKNSIAINELNPRNNSNSPFSIILLGFAVKNDDYYAIRTIIDKVNNQAVSFDVYNLHAYRGIKKGSSAEINQLRVKSQQTTFNISIRNLLENVKEIPLINEVFSDDVANQLGVSRRTGALTPSLKFSDTMSLSDNVINETLDRTLSAPFKDVLSDVAITAAETVGNTAKESNEKSINNSAAQKHQGAERSRVK